MNPTWENHGHSSFSHQSAMEEIQQPEHWEEEDDFLQQTHHVQKGKDSQLEKEPPSKSKEEHIQFENEPLTRTTVIITEPSTTGNTTCYENAMDGQATKKLFESLLKEFKKGFHQILKELPGYKSPASHPTYNNQHQPAHHHHEDHHNETHEDEQQQDDEQDSSANQQLQSPRPKKQTTTTSEAPLHPTAPQNSCASTSTKYRSKVGYGNNTKI